MVPIFLKVSDCVSSVMFEVRSLSRVMVMKYSSLRGAGEQRAAKETSSSFVIVEHYDIEVLEKDLWPSSPALSPFRVLKIPVRGQRQQSLPLHCSVPHTALCSFFSSPSPRSPCRAPGTVGVRAAMEMI